MPDLPTLLLVALGSYLLGGLSPARLAGALLLPGQRLDDTRVVLPHSEEADIRYRGVSATSVGAKLGPRWGVAIGIADALKAVLPMWAASVIWPESQIWLLVAVMVMAGHNWPVYFRFHGGRGQSVMIGALLFVDPLAPLVCFPAGMLVGLVLLKDMFVAYTLGQYLLIGWFAVFGTVEELAFAIAMNVIYTIAALPEAREYLAARQKGQVGKIKSFRDILRAHPAMGEKRFDEPDRDT